MSKKILVIEDNEKHGKLFNAILRSEGYDVVVVKDGGYIDQEIANSETSGKCFDLLLVDIAVPRFEAVAFIQKHKENYRILVVSAYSDMKELNGLVDDKWRIKKPFDIHDLLKRVKEMLGRSNTEDAK